MLLGFRAIDKPFLWETIRTIWGSDARHPTQMGKLNLSVRRDLRPERAIGFEPTTSSLGKGTSLREHCRQPRSCRRGFYAGPTRPSFPSVKTRGAVQFLCRQAYQLLLE